MITGAYFKFILAIGQGDAVRGAKSRGETFIRMARIKNRIQSHQELVRCVYSQHFQHQACGGFSSHRTILQISGHRLSVLPFISILTPITWG